MKQGTKKVYLFVFAALLLFFGCAIRSGVLVDRSLLPRYLLLAVLLLAVWLLRFKKMTFQRNNTFAIAFTLFYLWNIVSSLWAISPSDAIFQSQMVFLSLAVFLVISALYHENEEFERIFIKSLLVLLMFSFTLAFYKMSGLEYFDPYKIISVSANNNLYAGFLLLSMPLVLTGFSINKGFWRYFSAFTATMALFFIIIVQTRAAYIGLISGSLVSFILLIFRYRTVFSRRNILVGVICLAGLFAGITVFYSSLDAPRKNYFYNKVALWQYFRSYDDLRMENLLKKKDAVRAGNTQMPEFDYSEAYYENASLRIIFWKKSACLVKSHPLVGVGAGNWRINIPSCSQPPNPEHTFRNYTYSQPHNEWIAIISELGIIGFLVACCIFFGPLVLVLRRILIRSPGPPVSAVFYCCFIAGFYLYAAFDFPLRRIEHNVLLFTALAFLMRPTPSGSTTLSGSTTPSGSSMNYLFSTIIAILLLFTIFIAAARVKGEYFTVKMFRNEGKNDEQVIQYCKKAENPFYRITPNALPLAWFEGVAWYHMGDAGAALACFQTALHSTPFEVRILNDYAASLYSVKRISEAKVVLIHTIDIDPFFDDARFNLGAIYFFEGKTDSALLQVRQCRESQKKKDFLRELALPPGYPQ